MMPEEEGMLDHLRALQIKAFDHVGTFYVRLATWLVIGNAGALVLLFNGLVSGHVCDAAIAKQVYSAFAAGLFAAFCGASVSQLFSAYGLQLITKAVRIIEDLNLNNAHIADLEAQGITVAEDSYFPKEIARCEREHAALQKKQGLMWIGTASSIALMAISALCFAIGAALPVFGGKFVGVC